MSSRTSSSTQDSAPLPMTNAKVVQFTTTSNERKRFIQFHGTMLPALHIDRSLTIPNSFVATVISAVGLSEKASGKRPATSFVGMTVDKQYYTTSTVSSKDSDPIWHDNLGPIWLKDDAKITFKVKHRTMPLLPAQAYATTKTFRVQELVEQQKDLFDRNCCTFQSKRAALIPLLAAEYLTRTALLDIGIDLPLRIESSGSTASKLTINIRIVSSAESANEEVAKARARSNSIKQEAAAHANGLKSEDIDSGEDLRLSMKAAPLENDSELDPIPILPSRLSP
ncbi:hypothetical protein VNI00_011719 [Paramarasmius palmivorus]|uniref:C2 domain-containing protein n=1 Tax=Paramarasmius palmivorus TaxID=297713 RepID=A0AAW0CA54_9AGAR